MKNIRRIVKFMLTEPKSFRNICLWARKEVKANRLTALADKMGSDKGLKGHMYTRIYDALFKRMRDKPITLLEIGLLSRKDQRLVGGNRFATAPSLEMWVKYFKLAKIYGFDDKDFSDAKGEWSAIIKGDQSKREDLAKIVEHEEGFDIIIDDGLHASYHQQVTFSYLFSMLKPGGIFVIEDLHFQPDWAEEKWPADKTLHYLERLQISGVWDSPVATSEEKALIEDKTDSVRFFDSVGEGISGAKALAVVTKV